VALGVRAVPAFDLAIFRAIHHSKGPEGLGSAGRGEWVALSDWRLADNHKAAGP
jgi:hypothetical protein